MKTICTLFHLDLNDVPGVNTIVALTDAGMDVTYNNITYRSFGALLAIDKVTEENSMNNKGIKVTLSGLDMNTVELVNSSFFVKKPVTIYKAITREESNEVESASIYYRGITDVPEMNVDYKKNTVTLQVVCKSVFDLSTTPSLSRALNATHQLWHKGDKFFEFANQQNLEDEIWIR
jgi:hypothetical protein